jgi:DNA phosphorothioation-dependent restriction protein DptG
MNVFDLLKADHKLVADILEKLEKTTERAVKTRQELFEKLNQELGAHAYAEEKVLYPAVKEIDGARDLGFEAVEEHHVVKILLEELAAMPPDSEVWTAKLAVLKENVSHHVKEEEQELFPKARKAMSREEAEELGARIEEEKANFLQLERV